MKAQDAQHRRFLRKDDSAYREPRPGETPDGMRDFSNNTYFKLHKEAQENSDSASEDELQMFRDSIYNFNRPGKSKKLPRAKVVDERDPDDANFVNRGEDIEDLMDEVNKALRAQG